MTLNRTSILWVVMATFLFLSACGVRERLEEEAAEAIAETIVEQATGAEDVNFETGEDGSVSYSVEGEDGETVSVDFNAETDVTAIDGMGFTIPLPAGLVNGAVQRIGTDGDETMIVGQFEVQGLTAAQFYDSITPSLVSQGFVYGDPNGTGATQPNAENPIELIGANYTHPDGYIFNVLWGEESAIISLSAE